MCRCLHYASSLSYKISKTICLFYAGLFLEGARWSQAKHQLIESEPKVLYSPMPIIWMVPQEVRRCWKLDQGHHQNVMFSSPHFFAPCLFSCLCEKELALYPLLICVLFCRLPSSRFTAITTAHCTRRVREKAFCQQRATLPTLCWMCGFQVGKILHIGQSAELHC